MCERVVALVLEGPVGSWVLVTNLGWGLADSCAPMIASDASVAQAEQPQERPSPMSPHAWPEL